MRDLILLALPHEAPDMAGMGHVFYTGVGKVNAALLAAELVEKYKPRRIINFGTAGGITVGPGLHRATRFVQRDMQCVPLGVAPGQTPFDADAPVIDLGSGGLTCSTGDNFVVEPRLEIPADLVDMEAYAIAKICVRKGIEFACYKFVSDGADAKAGASWQSMIAAGQRLYQAKLQELFAAG